MPDPNHPEDRTRKRPAHASPGVAPSALTGSWNPTEPSDVQLAVPTHVGRFEVKAVLGTGTYGRVLLAYDPEMGRQVAIKQPFGEGLRPEYRDDFLKEARAAAVIDQHANICPVYHIDTDNGLPFIVMRFVAGGTLKNLIERRAEPLPTRTTLVIVRKIAMGLAAAHAKGVIHRDLKPANVLVDDANGEVLITDFGLARIASRSQGAASMHRGAHGTPFYMPPEQWGSQAFGPITPLADVYSLGVMLYEMLTGRPPFTGDQYELMTRHCAESPKAPSGLRPGLDPNLDAICLKALEKQPSKRYRSAREFADALNDYLRRSGEPIEALPLGEELDPSRSSALPWAHPLLDAPLQTLNRAGAAPPSASTAAQPGATVDDKEIIRCPKCNSRLEIATTRRRPIDCPLCGLKFMAEAGRQAAARAARAIERAKPLLPERSRRDDRRGGERNDWREERREDRPRRDDEGIAPWHWKPAARGLRLVWLGMLWCALVVMALVGTALASLDYDTPPRESLSRGASNSTKSGDAPAKGARPSESSQAAYHAALTLLGVGLSLGIVVMGVGRIQAAKLPAGVRGGKRATLSALAAWLAALCIAVPFVLIHWLVEEPREPGPGYTALTATATIAACAGLLLLLLGELAFNSYFTAIGRHVRSGFPRTLVTMSNVFVWIFLACALFGGAGSGIAAAMDDSKPPTGLLVFIGGAFCMTLVLAPFWAFITLWLNVHTAVVVSRYARSRG